GGQRRVVMHGLRKPGGIGEALAIESAARIDRRAPLRIAVLTRTVEILQGKSNRIGDLVASGANRIGTMCGQPLTCCAQRRFRVLDQREVDIRWWSGHGLTQKQLAQRFTAQCGRAAAWMSV